MAPDYNDDLPLPDGERLRVARQVIVFQVKLLADGFKDVLLSPLSLMAGLIGIVFGRSNPGLPFYELLRLGKRVEDWLGLFSAAYPKHPLSPETSVESIATGASSKESAPTDFDTLVDSLQSSLLDPETRARLSQQSRSQIEALAKKLRRDIG